MKIREELYQVIGRGKANDMHAFEFDATGRLFWLWDPPGNNLSEDGPACARLLSEPGERKGCVRVTNADQLEAYFFAIDKGLIVEQPGGQCDGIFFYRNTDEQACWVEMKMNITTYRPERYEETLHKALDQVINSMATFGEYWDKSGRNFLPSKHQRIAITVPAKPKRFRQTPTNFQVKAQKMTAGIKVFVVSEIKLPMNQGK